MQHVKSAVLTEDEPTFIYKLKLIWKMLNPPYTLKTFTKSDDMLEKFKSGVYQLCLIDINLKGSSINGLEQAAAVKRINNTLVYIMSTSDGSRPYKNGMTELEYAKSLNINGYILKAGTEMKTRLEELFKDIENGNTGGFKYYG